MSLNFYQTLVLSGIMRAGFDDDVNQAEVRWQMGAIIFGGISGRVLQADFGGKDIWSDGPDVEIGDRGPSIRFQRAADLVKRTGGRLSIEKDTGGVVNQVP